MDKTTTEIVADTKDAARALAKVLLAVACLAAVTYSAFHDRAPRPMFHDRFEASEDELFPRWRPNRIIADKRGSFAFADLELNLLVVLLTGEPDRTDISNEFAAGHATLFVHSGQPCRVDRSQNRLIVVRPDSQRLTLEIPWGAVRGWFEKYYFLDQSSQELTGAVATLVSRLEDTNRLRAFVTVGATSGEEP